MQFIDLPAQQRLIKDKINTNIEKVISHGKYIMGPEIKELEKRLADYVGVKHAIACSSGTDALLLALLAYNVKPGDAILTTPFTFIATAEVISLIGATPVFVDVDPETFNMDPTQLEKVIESSNMNLKGVIPVDLFGLPVDYDAIDVITKKHSLYVIEDAAQSFGGRYKDRMACSLGDIGCTSFFPAKPLGCYGDGGMCFTDNEKLDEIMRSLLVHGQGENKYENIRIGINGRMDTIQAAVLHAKLDIFPDEVVLREHVSKNYNKHLSSIPNLQTPSVPEGYTSIWAQYSVLAKDEEHRAIILSKLKEEGIPTAIYYPKPLHLQTAFAELGYKEGDFPVSEDISRRIFSLPMHPYLSEEEQLKIAKIIKEV